MCLHSGNCSVVPHRWKKCKEYASLVSRHSVSIKKQEAQTTITNVTSKDGTAFLASQFRNQNFFLIDKQGLKKFSCGSMTFPTKENYNNWILKKNHKIPVNELKIPVLLRINIVSWLFAKKSIKVFKSKGEWIISSCSSKCFHFISRKHHISKLLQHRTFKIVFLESLKVYSVYRVLLDTFYLTYFDISPCSCLMFSEIFSVALKELSSNGGSSLTIQTGQIYWTLLPTRQCSYQIDRNNILLGD